MHRVPGPWNTGVNHGSSTESPESLSLLSYKGLERVSEGLSRCCTWRRECEGSQCVARAAGGPGLSQGHAGQDLGAVCPCTATLRSCESCFGRAAKQRLQEWARHPCHCA